MSLCGDDANNWRDFYFLCSNKKSINFSLWCCQLYFNVSGQSFLPSFWLIYCFNSRVQPTVLINVVAKWCHVWRWNVTCLVPMIALCPLGQNGRDIRHRCAVQGLTTGTEMKKVFPILVWLIIDTDPKVSHPSFWVFWLTFPSSKILYSSLLRNRSPFRQTNRTILAMAGSGGQSCPYSDSLMEMGAFPDLSGSSGCDWYM